METEKYYQLALNFVEGVGNSTLKEILRIAGTAQRVFTEPECWISRLNKKSKRNIHITLTDNIKYLIDREIESMKKNNIKICHYLDKEYPFRLKRCNDSPLSFYYKGNIEFSTKHALAIVGTRNVSSYGIKSVAKIISDLKSSNLITVSGLAYGVDTCVHEESLINNLQTVAVLGCGLKSIYPDVNKNLANKIIDNGGAIISEFPFEMGPEKVNFPKRNRIIAGLSDAVVVVESALKGGSIITANIAQSYNRDIFAVPGSIFDENAAGCHNLIKKNIAAVITCGGDILEMMNWDVKPTSVQRELFVELSDEEQIIFDFLRSSSKSIDEISENFSSYTPSQIAGLLLQLELKGVIKALPGKRYEV